MATNRLYIVNTETGEYCCVAKCFHYTWGLGNVDLLEKLLGKTGGIEDKTPLIIGTENDDEFFEKHIRNGTNINKEGSWYYFNAS